MTSFTPPAQLHYKPGCELKPGMTPPTNAQRWALVVEYLGRDFHGFAKQATAAHTVQQVLETALSKVACEDIHLICAGRTDAGVHATGQIVHFDTTCARPNKAWVLGTNNYLPASIRVHHAQPMPWDFHARFSAGARTYRYLLAQANVPSATLADQISWTRFDLNAKAMQQACGFFLGEHDFTSFRAAQCQAKSPVRTITHIGLHQVGQLLVLEITANAFLHHMVRNIMGSLIEVGRGARPPGWIAEVLLARDRAMAAPKARASGLYLVGVNYPEVFALPARAKGPLLLPDELGGVI
ncbi:MAG: tRNA pseudouridine synthase [Pseudomonadota bacterium]|jgi:tRNA pseudouridine38-40 synthase